MTPAQTYSIRVTPYALGIRAEIYGEATYESTVAYWQAIATEVRTRRPKCLLLIDRTTGPPLSAPQWQSFVTEMRGQGFDAVRIAHVKPHGLQLIEHCEIYANEAGFDSRVFVDETQADLWLRYGER
jgi:hypothetical protein